MFWWLFEKLCEMVRSVRSRRWVFTLNNYTDDDEAHILLWENVKYLVVGREVGENGTHHLQGFVVFDKMMAFCRLRVLLPRAHWEQAMGNSKQAADYCKKDGNFKEVGVLSKKSEKNEIVSATRDILSGSNMAEVASEHPGAFVKYYRGLQAYSLLWNEPYFHSDVRGLWIYGKPGSGKSRYARTFNNIFLKSQNKWWDGYDGQDVVVLDDLDEGGVCLGHYLKIWSDRYACVGETKGGTINLKHKLFIVTSNYKIKDLFTEDNMMKSMLRRFIIYDFNIFPYNPDTDEERQWTAVRRGQEGVDGVEPVDDETDIPIIPAPDEVDEEMEVVHAAEGLVDLADDDSTGTSEEEFDPYDGYDEWAQTMGITDVLRDDI